MKKMLSLAALAAVVALSSCSSNKLDEVTPTAGDPAYINLNPFTGVQTKVADSDIETLKADTDGFQVYATEGAAPTSFAWDEAYKYDGAKWGWSRKWSSIVTFPVTFYATYPFQTLRNPAAPMFDFSVPVNGTTGANHVDLLAASATAATIPSSGMVPFRFAHLLSKINFQVEAGPGVKVYLQSIRLGNASESATYNLATKTWGSHVAPSTLPGYHGYVRNTPTPVEIAAGATSVLPVDASLMMIPAQNTAWDKTGTLPGSLTTGNFIEVAYRLENAATGANLVGYASATDAPNNASVSGPLFVRVAYPFATEWKMNNAYLYTISLGTAQSSGGTLIFGNFLKDDGTDSGIPVVDPSNNNNPISLGDPIVDVDKPIDLNVDVDIWVPATTSETIK